MEPIPANPPVSSFNLVDLKERYEDRLAEARTSKIMGRILMAGAIVTTAVIEAATTLNTTERLEVAAAGAGVTALFGIVFRHGRRVAEGEASVDRLIARTIAPIYGEQVPEWAA